MYRHEQRDIMALPKSTKKRKVKLARRKIKGLQAPSFEGWEKLDGEKFHRLKRQVNDFWYMNYKHTENIEHCFTWMKENGYSKSEISSAKKASKHEGLIGIYCRMLLDGCPDFVQAEDDYWQSLPGTLGKVRPMTEWVKPKIAELIEAGKDIIEEKKADEKNKKKAYVPSIQERLEEAAEEKAGELDEWIDNWMRDSKANPLKDKVPLKLFKKNQMNLGHLRFVTKWFEGPYQELQELAELPTASKRDDMQSQLAEGYDTYSKPQIKELTDFYKRLFDAIEIMKAEQKQNRAVRKPKVKSAQELVKKLKFKPSDGDFGIASVNPSDIIDATAVVVFNTKNRKLGIYYAQEHAGFKVKGTTLQFYDEMRSTQKTVRKPSEVLPNWKKVTKHKLKPQFGYLKTTETKLNGRFNADTIILKAFK